MTLHLRTTPYGPPALAALAEAVRRAKAGEPLAPVTVIVPSNHVGVTVRRLLACGAAGPLTPRGQGTIGVSFLTPYRLAELLGSARLAGDARRPVTTAVIAAAIRQALREDPGVFGPVAEHPATVQALLSAYQELTDLSTGGLDDLAGASPRATDTVRIYRAARAYLAAGWYDEQDLISAAIVRLEETLATASIGQVVAYLPQDLTRRSARLLSAVAEHIDGAVIAGLTGQGSADRGVHRSLARLGVATAGATGPSAAAGRTAGAQWPVSADRTRIVTTTDPEEEVRVVVDAIVSAARNSVALDRIAVLYPTSEPYARLLHEHLAAAELLANGMAVRSLSESTYGRALLQLLTLRDRGYRRSDVMDLLTSAPIRRPTGASAPTTEWERLSREAAVVAGRQQWDQRLTECSNRLDRSAAEIQDNQVSHERSQLWAARLARRANRVRDLRDLVTELIEAIETAAREPRSWAERVRWLRRTDGRLHGGEAGRDSWPADERQAATRVDAALDRLASLDALDKPCSLEVFGRTLSAELDADLCRTGRFGEGVLVAPLSFGVGLDLDLVAVVGLAEGTLPAQLADDSLLPDHERRRARGELGLRADHAARQQRQLRSALSAAARHVLTAPRGDLRASSHRSLSRWLAEMDRQLRAEASSRQELQPPVRDDQPSFAHRIRHSSFPATEQEFRLSAGSGAATDAIVAAGAEMIACRVSGAFTRYDGNLAGEELRSPTEQVVSATRLETWAECPHAYFMRHLLRVEPVEDPSEQLQISALDKGSLVHQVLERFVLAVLPDPPTTWADEHHRLLRDIANELCDAYEARGIVGRQLFWQRDRARLLATLDRFLTEEQALRRTTTSATPYRPAAAELAFGMPGAPLGPVEVPLPDGRRLSFRGSADRIDRTEEGHLRVVDYKTARSDKYRGLSEHNPDDRGTRLQLLVYGLAARTLEGCEDAPVQAQYWFVNEREPLTPIGYEVTDDVLERVGSTLATITDGISAGVFPARPTETATDPFVRCHYCNPDGLGVGDRKRAWELKKSDPALRGYVQLAEPDPEAA